MIHEELKLRPANGSIDHDAISAWLATKDYAFLDPVERKIWHLSASKQEMEDSQRERIANPKRMPNGAFVLPLPDHVSVNAYWAGNAEGRALEFIRWLTSSGEWTVQRDQAPFEPLGDPARLFPVGMGERDYLFTELTEGERHTWEAAGRRFIVHSSRQWALEDSDGVWRGEFSPWGMDEWDTAVALAKPEGELVDFVDPDSATGDFTIEDADGLERAYFDAASIPASLKPLASLVERWGNVLAGWNESSIDADLLRVRRE
ncbi:MAG: hypothetical protein IT370_21830 [Deltaproteobacteria bacterium]|nr:hypothetical protein [Deltaproteobacteria bacterium]